MALPQQVKYLQIENKQVTVSAKAIDPLPDNQYTYVKLLYTSLNRIDSLQLHGYLPLPPSGVLGFEGLGELQENVELADGTQLQKGQRVMWMQNQAWQQYVPVHKKILMPVPDNLPVEVYAGVPMVWITAYQLIYASGQMKAGQTALVHAAASGVGTSLIQLLKRLGCKVISSISSQEKAEFCQKLGSDITLNYKTQSQEEMIKTILSETGNKGVDVIFDCVGASYAQMHFQTIAVDGKWVVYGTMGGSTIPELNLLQMMMKRISLIGSALADVTDEQMSQIVKSMLVNGVFTAFQKGEMKPILDSTFKLEKITEAYQRLESNQTIGKIAIQFDW